MNQTKLIEQQKNQIINDLSRQLQITEHNNSQLTEKANLVENNFNKQEQLIINMHSLLQRLAVD